jgi:acetyl/propionyl-CoA carboxylase alpha subunit
MSPDFDTPENRAIVADVIANYDTLAAEWEAAQAKEAADSAVKAALASIDLKSIRSIREWLAKQADAPQFVKDHEAAAIAEREKLK